MASTIETNTAVEAAVSPLARLTSVLVAGWIDTLTANYYNYDQLDADQGSVRALAQSAELNPAMYAAIGELLVGKLEQMVDHKNQPYRRWPAPAQVVDAMPARSVLLSGHFL